VAVAWLAVLGTAAIVHAQSALPQPPSNAPASPPAVQSSPAGGVTAPTPPFWVAGVVLTAERRSAALVVLDDARRDVGLVTVREGESYGGYRLASVESDRVVLERDGTVTTVPVGRPLVQSGAAPEGARRFFFIPGPDKPTPDIPADQVQREPGRDPSAGAPSDAAVPANRVLDAETVRMLLERLLDTSR
jgi:hypothetical protein